MDPMLSSLSNLGAGGLMAAAVLWMHMKSLKAFRAELRQHRRVWARSVKRIVERLERIEAHLGKPPDRTGQES